MFNKPQGASMANATDQRTEGQAKVFNFPPLDDETRSAVDTETAAYHLNRATQTLRSWACKENGPLRPVRVHGRLAWLTEDIRRLLGQSAHPTTTK
jgi:hypothetical protein